MRILDPQVAKERKQQLLEWVIHRYIHSSQPIGSQVIAEKGGFGLSSATLRHVLKELEDEGYLSHSHPSAGRAPTDKGYRFYVDYLVEMQRLALEERERIEKEYNRKTEELSDLLSQTSRMLSVLSRSAGFALSPNQEEDTLRRLELVPLGAKHLLAIMVTDSGIVQHWPLRLSQDIPLNRLRQFTAFLNEQVQGMPVKEIRQNFGYHISRAEREFRDMAALARQFLREVAKLSEKESLYVEGTTHLLSESGVWDFDEFRSLLNILNEKKKFARILEEQFRDTLKESGSKGNKDQSLVHVKIGTENQIPELRNLSLVTSTYRVQGRTVGLLGILGPKRMEYPKIMALVNFVSHVVSRTLENWDKNFQETAPPAPRVKKGRS
ncbi:MAG: heat-inducible transcription repressor HrcA [Elusimicrobia bacterium]|nr:heat-inducible transcription repressor HrcA [Elusimicrobiota bacterium]